MRKELREFVFGSMRNLFPGHNYRRKQTFVIQLHVETKGSEEGKAINEVIEQSPSIKEHGLMQISLQTLQGFVSAQTIWLSGMHVKKRLFILIDS